MQITLHKQRYSVFYIAHFICDTDNWDGGSCGMFDAINQLHMMAPDSTTTSKNHKFITQARDAAVTEKLQVKSGETFVFKDFTWRKMM